MIPFSDEELFRAVVSHLEKVSQYVKSHGGGIKLLGVKDSIVYIELIGTCQGCAMSLMTTKMVVQKELRSLIHPELNLTNVDNIENTLPQDCYYEEFEEKETEPKKGFIDKVKSFF